MLIMKKKQRYTSDFQDQALAKAFARCGDQGIAEVAAGLSMSSGTLKGWMKRATQEQKTASGRRPRRRLHAGGEVAGAARDPRHERGGAERLVPPARRVCP